MIIMNKGVFFTLHEKVGLIKIFQYHLESY